MRGSAIGRFIGADSANFCRDIGDSAKISANRRVREEEDFHQFSDIHRTLWLNEIGFVELKGKQEGLKTREGSDSTLARRVEIRGRLHQRLLAFRLSLESSNFYSVHLWPFAPQETLRRSFLCYKEDESREPIIGASSCSNRLSAPNRLADMQVFAE